MRKTALIFLFFLLECTTQRACASGLTSRTALDKYIELCGSDKLCGNFGENNHAYPSSKKHCTMCTCDETCYVKGTCCPDLHLNTCVNISLYSASPSEKSITFVYLVSNCPASDTTPADGICETAPVAPVKGLDTNISYMNTHCAACNGEGNIQPWGLSIEECTKGNFDINTYSNLDSIYTGVAEFGCNFGYDWTVANAEVTKCQKMNIASCNVTGLWDEYDQDIEWVCEMNNNPYTFFSNIFCFICNTGKINEVPLINKCPIGSDRLADELCQSEKEDSRWFPYKNAFCHKCNNDDSSKLIQLYFAFNTSSPNPYELTVSLENKFDLICDLLYSPHYRLLRISDVALSMCSIEYNQTLNEESRSLRDVFDNTLKKFREIQNASRINIDFVSLFEIYETFGGLEKWCFSGQSKDCSCEDSCFLDHFCCADMMDNARYQCKKYKTQRLIVLDKCLSSYSDDVIRYFCERDETDSGTVVDHIPVVSSEPKKPVQYKNIFCLLCNSDIRINLSESRNWFARTMTFRCPKYINVDHSMMLSQTYMHLENLCDLEIQISNNEDAKFDCGSPSLFGSIVSSCPYTDKLFPHKDDIVYLCENSSMLIYREMCTRYANIFCEICDSMSDCNEECPDDMQSRKIDYKTCDFFTPPVIVPEKQHCEFCIDYRHLFSLYQSQSKGKRTAEQHDCEITEARDPRTNECREVFCCEGKEYRNGCKTLLSRTTNLQYSLTVGMNVNMSNLEEHQSVDHMRLLLRALAEKIEETFEDLSQIHTYHISCKDIENKSDVESILISFKIRVKTNGAVSRDETEERLFSVQSELEQFRTDDIVSKISMTDSSYVIVPYKDICHGFVLKSTLTNGHVFHVDKFLTCPQFILNEKEYLIESGYLVLTTNLAPKKHISFTKDRAKDVRVCISDYVSLFLDESDVTWLSFWEILPTVCVSSSTLCLCLTIIVYSALKQYNSLPGKNILCLIVSQLLAQTMLFFKNIRIGDTFCVVIGGVIHYTWLTMFFATANCTIHMHMAFNVNFVTRNKKESIFFISLFLILAGPMLIVGAYLLYVYIIEQSNPYQTTTCFITDFFSLLVFFHVPISIICTINLVFFILISYNLHTLTHIRSNKDKRNNSIICLKLFLVTGLSWILQLVESFFPYSNFTYAVSVVNGCQGVFIFLVLILSKNVRGAMKSSVSKTDSSQLESVPNRVHASSSSHE